MEILAKYIHIGKYNPFVSSSIYLCNSGIIAFALEMIVHLERMEFNNNNNNSHHLIRAEICQNCTRCIKYNKIYLIPTAIHINLSFLQIKKLKTNKFKCNDQREVANKPLS